MDKSHESRGNIHFAFSTKVVNGYISLLIRVHNIFSNRLTNNLGITYPSSNSTSLRILWCKDRFYSLKFLKKIGKHAGQNNIQACLTKNLDHFTRAHRKKC